MNVDTGAFRALTDDVAQLQAEMAQFAARQEVADRLVQLVTDLMAERHELAHRREVRTARLRSQRHLRPVDGGAS